MKRHARVGTVAPQTMLMSSFLSLALVPASALFIPSASRPVVRSARPTVARSPAPSCQLDQAIPLLGQHAATTGALAALFVAGVQAFEPVLALGTRSSPMMKQPATAPSLDGWTWPAGAGEVMDSCFLVSDPIPCPPTDDECELPKQWFVCDSGNSQDFDSCEYDESFSAYYGQPLYRCSR